MPAPSLTEEAKLLNLGLIVHYQNHKKWYIQQARVIVSNGRQAISFASKTASGSVHIFTPDEVGVMLRVWLMNDPQWRGILQHKPHLPPSQYDLITDSMARYVVYDEYTAIIS